MKETKYLTLRQVARRLRCSNGFAFCLCQKGLIYAEHDVQTGRWYIPKSWFNQQLDFWRWKWGTLSRIKSKLLDMGWGGVACHMA